MAINIITDRYLTESGICECCGMVTMNSGGTFMSNGVAICQYRFRWTKDNEDEPWALFIICGEGSHKIGISMEFRRPSNGMMIVDSERFKWPMDFAQMVNEYHQRSDIKGTEAEGWVRDIFDFLFTNDGNIPRK